MAAVEVAVDGRNIQHAKWIPIHHIVQYALGIIIGMVRRLNMKRVLVVSMICLVMLVIASGAFGQEAKPCAGDVAKFCGNVKPGEGRMAGCLKQNEAQLSPACKMHLMQMKEVLKEADKACEDDIAMYCGGVKPGDGQIMKCLKANKSHLSRRCKVKLFEAKEEMK